MLSHTCGTFRCYAICSPWSRPLAALTPLCQAWSNAPPLTNRCAEAKIRAEHLVDTQKDPDLCISRAEGPDLSNQRRLYLHRHRQRKTPAAESPDLQQVTDFGHHPLSGQQAERRCICTRRAAAERRIRARADCKFTGAEQHPARGWWRAARRAAARGAQEPPRLALVCDNARTVRHADPRRCIPK